MKTASLPEHSEIEPETLIGTKWIGIGIPAGDSEALEFLTERICMYTARPYDYPKSYTVSGNKVFLGGGEEPFELREATLFFMGNPAFKKS